MNCEGPLYNCRIMAVLNDQLEKLRSLEVPTATPSLEMADYTRQLRTAEILLQNYADQFYIRDFCWTQSVVPELFITIVGWKEK